MCMEDKAVKELNELKAQVNALTKCLLGDHKGGFLINMASHKGRLKFYNKKEEVLKSSPAQCLKQHDLDLLNQLKDKFINSNQSCELILADMINSLELENE